MACQPLMRSLLARPRLLAFLFSLVVPASAYLALLIALGAAAPHLGMALAIVAMGLALGLVLAPLAGSLTAVQITVAATAGLFLGWLAVVVLTWGFALQGAPALFAYAAACHIGQLVRLAPRR